MLIMCTLYCRLRNNVRFGCELTFYRLIFVFIVFSAIFNLYDNAVIVVCFCNVVAISVVIGSAIVGIYSQVTLHLHILRITCKLHIIIKD